MVSAEYEKLVPTSEIGKRPQASSCGHACRVNYILQPDAKSRGPHTMSQTGSGCAKVANETDLISPHPQEISALI